MVESQLLAKEAIKVRALFIGQSIDLSPFLATTPMAQAPLTVAAGEQGCVVIFDYGAVVLFGLSPMEEARFLNDLGPLVRGQFEQPEMEETEIHHDPNTVGKVDNGLILLGDFTIPSLQLVADVLAKSVVLAHYEVSVADVFDRIEPFAISLQKRVWTRRQGDQLLRQIGSNLLIQHKMVGRVEIVDKPELLWEYPELDRLHARLEGEYEVPERHLALERKLELVSRTVETALELQQQRTSLRLEWYIVLLIVVEVLLSLYELFIKG